MWCQLRAQILLNLQWDLSCCVFKNFRIILYVYLYTEVMITNLTKQPLSECFLIFLPAFVCITHIQKWQLTILIKQPVSECFFEILASTYGPGAYSWTILSWTINNLEEYSKYSKSNMLQENYVNAHCSMIMFAICFWSKLHFLNMAT